MTPRLKLLSALLCLSIVYAVYDYIDRNNIDHLLVFGKFLPYFASGWGHVLSWNFVTQIQENKHVQITQTEIKTSS